MKKLFIMAVLSSVILLIACGTSNVKISNTNTRTRDVQFGKTVFSIPKNWVEEYEGATEFWNQTAAYHKDDEEYTYILAFDYKDMDKKYGPAEKEQELKEDGGEIDGVKFRTQFKETEDAKAKIVNGAQIYRYVYAEEHYKGDKKEPDRIAYMAIICVHRDDLHYDLLFNNFEKDSKIWDIVYDSIDVAD